MLAERERRETEVTDLKNEATKPTKGTKKRLAPRTVVGRPQAAGW